MGFRKDKNLFFKLDGNIYWDGQYEDIMFLMRGQNGKGEKSHPAMYATFAEASILAAAIGLKENRQKKLSTDNRREIPINIYKGRSLGDKVDPTLDEYIALMAIIKLNNVKLLEDENDDNYDNQKTIINTFQELVNGGLEFLRGELSQSRDPTGKTTLYTLINTALKDLNGEEAKDKELTDIFSI